MKTPSFAATIETSLAVDKAYVMARRHVGKTARTQTQLFKAVELIVADYYDLRTEDFRSKSRAYRISHPRQILFRVLVDVVKLTPVHVAKHYGVHRKAVHYAVKAVNGLCSVDPQFKAQVDCIAKYASRIQIYEPKHNTK